MRNHTHRPGIARILMMLAISLTLTMAGTPQLQPINGVLQLQPISEGLQIQPINGALQLQPLTAAAEELPVTSIPHFADRFYLRNLAPELQRDAAAVYQGIASFEEEIVLPDETGYDSIERIFFVLKYDCPELFQVSFDSGTLLKTYNGIVHSIKPSYVMGREEYAQRLAQCREILAQMIREAETYAGQPRKVGRGAGASGPGARVETGPGAGLATGPGAGAASGSGAGTASGPGAGLETGPGAGLGTGPGAGLETGSGVGPGMDSATELTRQEAAELYLYDRLTDWITYSTTAPGCENAYGALVGRAAKCDGISIAMKWVMEESGIPAMVITGQSRVELPADRRGLARCGPDQRFRVTGQEHEDLSRLQCPAGLDGPHVPAVSGHRGVQRPARAGFHGPQLSCAERIFCSGGDRFREHIYRAS